MCGILGTIPNTEAHFFKETLDTLAHRGPDHAGVWSDDENISLGQRRLAILDLSEVGQQPMFDVSLRYAIVFNGEIYNFIEIKKELQSKGYTFRSNSDTEVLLYAYIEWNTDCLLKFNGMWAFAIWNRQEKKLFLARDRFGKKPLFYAFIKDKFVFASEMKAIYPYLPEIKCSKDFEWMKNNIFLYESTDKCLIEGIKRFPAGSYGFYISNRNLSIHRYWNTLDHLVSVPTKYEDQVEEFRALFIDACKIRMRSDVCIGTALSGGLDSSATISVMAFIAQQQSNERLSKDWQHAFVATFPNTPLDESYFAKKVVDNIGIEATYLPIDPLKSWDKIEHFFYMFEELYITSPIPMIQLYGAIREHGTIVSLDGHGADELFSGYGSSLFEAMPDAFFNTKKRNSIFDAYYDLFGSDQQIAVERKNQFLDYLKYYYRQKRNTFKGKNQESIDKNHPNFKKLDNFNKHLYIMSHETILPTLLRNYDRYAMINGVEIRMPFMDHRLVSYAMSLPWESKIRNGYTKSIVRDAVSPFMPKEIAYRKTKIGFNTPIIDWMKNELKDYFLDIIHSENFRNCGSIDATSVKNEILHVIANPQSTYKEGERAWIHFMPYLWHKSILKK